MSSSSTSLTAGMYDAGPLLDWPALWAAHERWLRTVVFARVREGQGVDEVMQEVCVAALGEKNRPVASEKVAPWLYRVAVWQSLMYRRRQGRRRKLHADYAEQSQGLVKHETSPDDSPLGWLLRDERSRWVREALSDLPRRDAEMLLLKYSENWSYRSIAEHLGISPGAVEARLHRGRERLRRILASRARD